VSGRADVPFEGQVEMDVEYVESHNFWLDLRLVASTVPAVITGRGAY
jgi:lipopolysaccharide/colanic/teichoic acid biosynthesis glycosyltransferase